MVRRRYMPAQGSRMSGSKGPGDVGREARDKSLANTPCGMSSTDMAICSRKTCRVRLLVQKAPRRSTIGEYQMDELLPHPPPHPPSMEQPLQLSCKGISSQEAISQL
jgi:hypothetical protein